MVTTATTGDPLRITIISPHFDDAVFSIGATMSHLARRGCELTVATMFGGDPRSSGAPSAWDSRCGFVDRGQAARLRRAEDGAACALVVASTRWSKFEGCEYGRPPRASELAPCLENICTGSDLVLVPGFPLTNPDHQAVSYAARSIATSGLTIGGYAEEPYASLAATHSTWRAPRRARACLRLACAASVNSARLLHTALPRHTPHAAGCAPHGWVRTLPPPSDWRVKWQAMGSYHSQLAAFSAGFRPRLFASHLAWGGELIWIPKLTAIEANLASVYDLLGSIGHTLRHDHRTPSAFPPEGRAS
jgi:LmbE family N-acetylglucosaminyl deacetylase